MHIPTKTLKSGFSMPVFGLGTWHMGGDFHRDLSNNDAADSAAIERAIDAGITHIDTAEIYAEGHAEELVGTAIRGRKREDLFLVSKVSWRHAGSDDILRAIEGSLKRLGVSYLDLYLLHKPNPTVPLKETMRAMDLLQEQGLIRNIGVSNFAPERLKRAQQYATHPVVVNQVHYNLKIREPERKGLLTYCQQHDVLLAAWRPVQGLEEASTVLLLQKLARKYEKTPMQIALNWLLSQSNVVTLAKMKAAEHLQENLGAIGWQMEVEDIEILRAEFPGQHDVSDAVELH